MLFRKSPRPARRSAVPVARFRPQVEALECRLTPSVYQVTSNADGTGTVTTNGHAGTIADPYLATTLRAAINAANLDSSTADTINFATTVEGGTITLTSGLLELKARTGSTTIDGSPTGVTVDGNHTSEVFKVDASASATLNDLTITHGSAAFGGGIYNAGTLMLTNSTVSYNSAGGGSNNQGGGIYNVGTLTVTNSTLTDNSASGGTYDYGGGIYDNGTLTVTNSTLSYNSATGGTHNLGGGIEISGGGTLTLTNSTLTRNSVSGTGSSSNVGGGIADNNMATVTNSTLTYNTASGGANDYGGGIEDGFKLTVTNSTLAYNSVNGTGATYAYGGGIDNENYLTVTNSTLADNSETGGTSNGGGGIDNDGTLTLTNTIVAYSTGADFYENTYGSISGSNNLVKDGSDSLSDTIHQDPLLGSLGSYGGPTQTFALLPGSPALNAGITTNDPSTSMPITTDQRGFAVDSPTPDIGAYQLQSSPFQVTTATDPGQQVGLLSLREAVNLANVYSAAGNSADITFAPAVSSITLTAGVLELTAVETSSMATVTIDGSPTGVTVDGNHTSEVFKVDANASATLNDLTITHGSATKGGGISNAGTLMLTNSTVSYNSVSGGTFNDGGGIYNVGTLTVTNSTLTYNSATGGTFDYGGGIYNNATLTVTNSTLSYNSAATGGTYNLGGGIDTSGTLTLTNSTLTHNSVSGTGSSDNEGGGIADYGTATVTNSTLTYNSNSGGAYNYGGGIEDGSMLTVTNSTLAYNSATDGTHSYGGGIDNENILTVTNSTLAYNTESGGTYSGGGGIDNNGALTLTNTIVAYSTGVDFYENTYGSVSGSNNLVKDGSDSLSDTIHQDPLLGSLGSYGGPTQTFPLLPGSPALNAGITTNDPSTSMPITTDQRGFAVDSPTPDIGAYQLQSSPFLVTTAADPGQQVGLLSLREAVNLANLYSAAGYSPDITFAPAIRTITLTAGVLELTAVKSSTTASVTIDGSPAGVTVDGNYASEVFLVDNNGSATLNDLTITHGVSYEGGGISNEGTLTLTNSTVSDNSANGGSDEGGGGGIYNDGTLTVMNSTVSNNSLTSDTYNLGGGIFTNGTLTLTNSTVSYNSATGGTDEDGGGGIYNGYTLTVTNSTISNNSVSGTGSSFNAGGGIYDNNTLTVTNSTLTYNSASGGTYVSGGGIGDYGTTTLTNSTLAYNSATDDTSSYGGGIDNENILTVTNSTIAYNTETGGTDSAGGGIENDGTLTLTNTIVASSTGADIYEDRLGTISGSNNLIDDGQYGLSDTIVANPLLGSLGSYGGPTQTMPLLPGSPALNAGITTNDPSTSMPITTDQRGFAVDSPTPDIGAYQVQSNPFLVTTAADPGQQVGLLSLREAVNLANVYSAAGDSPDITFAPAISTITLTAGVLELTAVKTSSMATVTIDGSPSGVTVNGNQASEVFKVDANAVATLNDLTISGGVATQGGGIYNVGTLTLTNSTVSNNSATGAIGYHTNEGGGIDNNGTLTVTNSTFTNNSASGMFSYGGGIANDEDGTLTLMNSTVTNNSASGSYNYGGGIASAGMVTLSNSTFTNNSATDGSGGGIFAAGTMTLTNSILTNNSASNGGGIYNNVSLTITNSTFTNNTADSDPEGNEGGGIYNNDTLTVTNSSFIDNSVSGGSAYNEGGGIYNDDMATLTNCTLAYNSVGGTGSSENDGGGIENDYQLTLTNCTLDGNSTTGGTHNYGGGIDNNGVLTLTNTIVASSTGADVYENTYGSISGSNNLVKDGSDGLSDTIHQDPLLGVLGYYGGTTPTLPLLPGSPALKKAIATDYPGTSTPITTDQRGFALDSPPDIGAYQLQANPFVVTTAADPESPGLVSLRDAVNLANVYSAAGYSPDITFASGINTITLTAGVLELTAVKSNSTATVTIDGSPAGVTVDGNESSGVFELDENAVAILNDLTIIHGVAIDGGGILNDGTLTLTVCTVANNSATGGADNEGGGIYNGGTLTVTNCTLAYNCASGGVYNDGGGIENDRTLTLTNSTLAYNSATGGQALGGGILNDDVLTLTNTIVADSVGGDIYQDYHISGSHNLVEDGSDGLPDTIKMNPLLGSLGYYGGPTPTIPLLPGSPALKKGITADYPGTTTPITTDQRGFGLDSPPDIGAYQAQANPFVVTTAADPESPGLVSLRDAVNLANAYSAAGYSADITFASGISKITLTAGPIELSAVECLSTALVTIDGGSTGVTVDANQASEVFLVENGASVLMNDLTITHGVAVFGGGILNEGTLTLTDCTVANNSATGGAFNQGGGIYNGNYGTLTLTNSTVANNSATGTDSFGGGLYNFFLSTVTITNCTLANNSSIGASYSEGGGLDNAGTMTITNSTLASNSATGPDSNGGGIFNAFYGTLTLTNSTLANNSINTTGSGSGGGIVNDGGTFTLTNTIVAYSTGADISLPLGTVTGSNNLVDDGSDGLPDTIKLNPLLGSLGYYGGPTQTLPLLPGSPALKKAIATDYPGTSTLISTDQRGFALDTPKPDIGAYQLQANPFLVTTATDPGRLCGLLSLREAVNLANAYSAAGDSADIKFNSGITSITLTAGVLELTAAKTSTTASVTIDGGTTGVTVDGNHASEVFQVDSGALATLNALTITHGSATIGGGILNKGTLTLTNSTVSYNCAVGGSVNHGGGIYNDGTLTLTDSTVANNSAKNGGYNYGGGIVNAGTLTLTNSTIAYNSATGGTGDYGGGIYNDYQQTLTSTNSTLADNSVSGGSYDNGGGIFNNTGTMTLTNTIIAYSTSTGGDIDNNGGTLNGSHNLIDDGKYGLSDTIVANPKLGSLANNGGLTQTFALLTGSPAVDAGSDTVTSSPYNLSTDQRGLPRLSGAHVDIGSFEAQIPILTHFYVLYGNGLKYDLLGSTRMDLPWQITGIQTVYSTTVTGTSSSLSGFSVTSFSGSGTTTLTWNFAALADVDVVAKLAGTGGNAITSSDGQGLASGVGISQSVKVLYGDVNGDGVVNSTDIADVQVAALGKTVPVANNFLDVNGDGVIDSNDLTIVRTRSGHKLV